MSIDTQLPNSADLIIVGSGTAGAAVAGIVAESAGPDVSVLLLEAGPDYGARDSGLWPEDLLDAGMMAVQSHDWGYEGVVNGRPIAFHRAKVMGGCSSHNAGAVSHGTRADYDGWAAAGNPGWATDDLLPLFDAAWRRLHVRTIDFDDLTPFQTECVAALEAIGIPRVEDFNNLDENIGIGALPIHIAADGTRINSPFAYVDSVRSSPNFTVCGDAQVERVLLEGTRAVGVVVRHGDTEVEVRAKRVVLCGGAYGSPLILLRSGIGPAKHLQDVGVPVVLDLPGVGENLHDQPAIELDYEGSDELKQAMTGFADKADHHWCPDEQITAKFRSAECTTGFDLHIGTIGGRDSLGRAEWRWTIMAAVVTPESRGWIRLTGPTSEDLPDIDHRYLSDSAGSDVRRLVEAVTWIRKMAAQPNLSRLIGTETFPGSQVQGTEELTQFINDTAVHYYHPAGSCKMGPATDPAAVVDAQGAVHGIEGLFVADASIMPRVTSGQTNMPTAVVGEKIGGDLAALYTSATA